MYLKGKEYKLNFIGRKKIWFGVSAVLVLISIIAFSLMGLNLGIEFRGGFLLRTTLESPATVPQVEDILSKYADQGLGKSIIQVSDDGLTLTMRLPLIEDESAQLKVIEGIKSDLKERYGIPQGEFMIKTALNNPAAASEVEEILERYKDKGLQSYQVALSEEGKSLSVYTNRISDEGLRVQFLNGVKDDLNQRYGLPEDDFTGPVREVILDEELVGSEWGKEISRKAIISLVVFLAIILVYISFRFEFKMSVPAIVALVHDTIITVGVYALTRRQVTPATVIAFLTILGYSLYDTIVVFDRISENVNLMDASGRRTYSEVVNESVNQTMMRSIGTTLTTLLPIFTILLFGGETLKDFAFALFIGVILGSASSIFIAPEILALWKETEPRYAAIRSKAEKQGARERVIKKRAEVVPMGKKREEAVGKMGEKEKAAAGVAAKQPARADTKGAAQPAAKPSPKTPSKGAPKKKPGSGKATTRGPAVSKKKKKKKKR